jgi:diadenylate cyclase
MDVFQTFLDAFNSLFGGGPGLSVAEIAKIIAEFIIIAYAITWLWLRIRNTQAESLVKGVLVLVFVCALSWFLQLSLILVVLQHLIPVAVLAVVIVFQPELRRGLNYLGQAKAFRVDFSLSASQKSKHKESIREIIKAVKELSRNRVGALIVVEPPAGERDYVTPGVTVNADVSSILIQSIFVPIGPLHDGAVVVRENKIIAAGVLLPITDNPKLSYRYGTRHRAAIGLSEVYDGLCIVVSEETGAISAASHGMLVKYSDAEELFDPLSYIYEDISQEAPTPLRSFLSLFSEGAPKEKIETESIKKEITEISPVDNKAPLPNFAKLRSPASLSKGEDVKVKEALTRDEREDLDEILPAPEPTSEGEQEAVL